MSKIEIGILIALCLLPIITLVIVLPKKSKKKAPPPTKEYVPETIIAEEPITKPAKPASEEPVLVAPDKELYKEESFRDYLKDRSKKHQPPMFKQPDEDDDFMKDIFTPGDDEPEPVKEETSMAEEISHLSPELKAMLLSGVLERKDFDKDN